MKPYFTMAELDQEYPDLLPSKLSVGQLFDGLREAGDEIEYRVTPDDIARFVMIVQAFPRDRRTLGMFLDNLPTAVGKKVKMRSPHQISDFIMSRYPKPQVQQFLHSWAVFLYARQVQVSPDGDIDDNFAALAEALSPFHAYAFSMLVTEEAYPEEAKRRYPEGPEALFDDYYGEGAFATAADLMQAHFINYALRRYKALHQAIVTNEVFARMEATIAGQHARMSRLNTKLDRASQHTAKLKKELDVTQKTSDEMLDEALEKIEKLEAQLQEERMQHARDIADFCEQISDLKRQGTNAKKSDIKPLDGLSVAVIGDNSRQNSYREIIEDTFGGQMRFCNGLDVSPRLRSTCHWADVIVLVTCYMQHKTEQVVRAEMHPDAAVVRVNTAGVATFFRTIEEFAATSKKHTG